MKCRNCGAEIADKALICYRCGAATTDAKYQPVQLRPKRRRPSPILVGLIALLLLLALIYYFRLA